MKRSEINAVIREFEIMLVRQKIPLPPFLGFTPEEWARKGRDYDEIRQNGLGWDVTDYGQNDYAKIGMAMIVLHNGSIRNFKYSKNYAEKIMMTREGQITPNHFHWNKSEDITNLGGGDAVFRLWNADQNEGLSGDDVEVFLSGRRYLAPAGSETVLRPGDFLSIYPYCYHEFTARPGTGTALLGEVSMWNDDSTDNRFLEPLDRFPTIEEDVPPYRLLCTEYPAAGR